MTTSDHSQESPATPPQSPPPPQRISRIDKKPYGRRSREELERMFGLRPNPHRRLIGGTVPPPKLPPNFADLWAEEYLEENPEDTHLASEPV